MYLIRMLSDSAIQYLQPFMYRADAKRILWHIPLGGICWDDEITDFMDLFKLSQEDRNSITRLFSIRFKIWDGEPLSSDDQQFWDTARSQVPHYALFHRLVLSDEDRAAQEQVESEILRGFDILEDDGIKLMTKTDLELPCPTCEYDLRGLTDGCCPACGEPFSVEDLEPERPGLTLESWADAACTFSKKAILPLAIAFSPCKAFQRRCRLENILTTASSRILSWFLASYLILMVISVAARYTLDKVQGRQLILGGYWDPSLGHRFGSAVLLPVHIPLAWLQCLVVAIIGLIISRRRLPALKIVRLATWLLPITLLGGLFLIFFDPLWYKFIAQLLVLHPSDLNIRLHRLGSELVFRGPDLVLGLAGGFAVGTVLQKRRWLIALISATVLVALFPTYLSVQQFYAGNFYEPVRELAVGPRPTPIPRPMLLPGPTFTVGGVEPSLAGTWMIRYEEEEHASTELTFDDTGALVSWKPTEHTTADVAEFISDGMDHDIPVPEEKADTLKVSYRVLSGCNRQLDRITIRLRLELEYTRQIRADLSEQIPDVAEESLVGIFDTNEDRIQGTSMYVRDCPGVNFEPGRIERRFVMTRSTSAGSQEEP